jgi:hypothetical protein
MGLHLEGVGIETIEGTRRRRHRYQEGSVIILELLSPVETRFNITSGATGIR